MSARPTAGGWTTSCPPPRSCGRSTRRCRSNPADANYVGEVAERWRYRDGSGEIGVIASVTQAFCRDCTRARLSTDGKLYTCLFATDGFDLRALARDGTSDAALSNAIAAIWRQRADRYSEIRSAHTVR
jgi:cyclic pyranopterin phosphate synthase